MWRRTRTPDGVRIELDAPAGPTTATPPTDAELIAHLQRQLAAKDDTIARLGDRLAAAVEQPQRHPAAETRAEEVRAEQYQKTVLIIRERDQEISDLKQTLKDAQARLAHYEGDGWHSDRSCPSCAGLRRTIATLEAGQREDRKQLARLTLGAA